MFTADTYTSVLPELARSSAEATAALVRAAAPFPPGRPDQPAFGRDETKQFARV